MRGPLAVVAGVAAATTLTAMSMVGCGSHSKSSTATSRSATSTQAGPSDYTTLLIKASDINAPEPFTASPPVKNPNGQPGAAITFSDQDRSHTIVDTIQVLPNPAAATNALGTAKTTQSKSLRGKPAPIDVGAGGTTISGTSADRSKGITMLLFTAGRAFITLEFDGPSYVLAPPDFITDVGQKQNAAVKKGLGG